MSSATTLVKPNEGKVIDIKISTRSIRFDTVNNGMLSNDVRDLYERGFDVIE